MSTTIKSKKKPKRSTQRALVVKKLANRYDVTVQMVYQALKNDRTSELAEEIKKEYNRLIKAIDNVLK